MSVLRIALDGNEANVANRVGSNVYAYEILKQVEVLTRKAVADTTIQVTVLSAEPPIKDLPKARPGWQYQILSPRPLWTQWALPVHLFLHRHRYDVLFTPGHYAPRLASIPYVSSVMDLAYLEYPEQFKSRDLLQLTHWTAYSVKHAQKIVAISEFTKECIVKQYHRSPGDVVVAYPAVTPPKKEPTSLRKATILKKYSIKKPFILYVGTIQPRKNLITLIEAFESAQRSLASGQVKKIRGRRQSASELQLVIAGKIGWLAEETVQRIKDSPFFEDIILTGYISEDVKQVLLKEAAASVLVGFYEGFGIPPLEAMQVGTLPIVSNTTSLPEVVGQGGILVDPTSHHSIADGIKKALQLTATGRAKYRREMRKQLKKFDWGESAQKILSTLIEVAKSQ